MKINFSFPIRLRYFTGMYLFCLNQLWYNNATLKLNPKTHLLKTYSHVHRSSSWLQVGWAGLDSRFRIPDCSLDSCQRHVSFILFEPAASRA